MDYFLEYKKLRITLSERYPLEMVYRFKGDTQQKEKKENDKVCHKRSECSTTMYCYL